MVHHEGALSVCEVNHQHIKQISNDRALRVRIAEWIGASAIKAALFPGSLMYAITQRGYLYVIQRDGVIVGAAFMKYIHKTLCGFPIHPVNWAVLYGIGSDDPHAFNLLYEQVLQESTKKQVARLHLLREDQTKRMRVSIIDKGIRIIKEGLPVLDLRPPAAEMRFYRVAQ